MVILFLIGIEFIQVYQMLKISFDFNEESQTVSNVKVTKTAAKYDDIDLPIIEVSESKLIFSPQAISTMCLASGDRISVNYIQKNNELTFPVIGKSEVFADSDSGNKLSKSNTVLFRGTQNTILTKYGKLFKLEYLKSNMFKLVAIQESEINSNK